MTKKGPATLSDLFSALNSDITFRLETARAAIKHSTSKGDASENIWLDLFNQYLPERYRATKGFVVDSKGQPSEQIDVIIHDRQYTPFLFRFEGSFYVPAEAVYAVFEVKQELNKKYIKEAKAKAASVRKLWRTSAKITYAGGQYKSNMPKAIVSGILALTAKWKDGFEVPFDPSTSLSKHLGGWENNDEPIAKELEALTTKLGRSDLTESEKLEMQLQHNFHQQLKSIKRLDIICAADKGTVVYKDNGYQCLPSDYNVTRFLFTLISMLQELGTVPAIDMNRYIAAMAGGFQE